MQIYSIALHTPDRQQHRLRRMRLRRWRWIEIKFKTFCECELCRQLIVSFSSLMSRKAPKSRPSGHFTWNHFCAASVRRSFKLKLVRDTQFDWPPFVVRPILICVCGTTNGTKTISSRIRFIHFIRLPLTHRCREQIGQFQSIKLYMHSSVRRSFP